MWGSRWWVAEIGNSECASTDFSIPPLDDVHYRRQRWSRREIAIFGSGASFDKGHWAEADGRVELIFFRRNRDAGTCIGERLFCGVCFLSRTPTARWFPFQRRHLDQPGDFRVASAAVTRRGVVFGYL